MEIRPVTNSDVEGLNANCFSANTVDGTRAQVESAIESAATGEEISLVAVENGEVLANLTVTRNHHPLSRHRAEVGGFVVTGPAQGTGLARKLLGEAMAWAKGKGCSILEISCRGGTHAETAYRGLGFKEWGRLPGGIVESQGKVFDLVYLYINIERP